MAETVQTIQAAQRWPAIVLWAGLAVLAAILLLPQQADAQCVGGPLNNCFANPIVVGAVPYSNTQSTSGATLESGEPQPCGGIGATVWYQWTPSASGTATVTTNNPGSNYDTVLAAYTGATLGTLVNQACNDDFPSCCLSQITFSCTAGTTYRIQLGGFGGATGTAQMTITGCDGSPPPPCPGPANNCFANPILVGAVPYGNAQSSVGATTEAGEPSPCGGTGATVWYRWTATTSGSITMNTFGSNYDTVLAAYTGSSLGALTNLACNDDTAGLQSQITIACNAGTTYQIQIGGFGGSQTGNIQFNMGSCSAGPACSGGPANNCFANPIIVGGTPYANTQSTVGATMESGEPAPCGALGSSVWYNWTPGGSGTATISTNNAGSNYDTVLAAYTGASVTGLTTVACNDDFPTCCQSQITFTCTAGTTYRIQLSGFASQQGTAAMTINGCTGGPAVAADAYTILEDAASATYNVMANDGAGLTVVSITSGACVNQPSCATTLGTASVTPGGGSVTYVPGQDRNGADSFQYRVQNGAGQTSITTVTMTVTAVNDAPSFTRTLAVIETMQGQPVQVYPGWATNVTEAAGLLALPVRATDEAPQSITFPPAIRTVSNPGIFAVQPTLDRTTSATSTITDTANGLFGVLRFTPSTNTFGNSQVCFRAQDSGSGLAPNVNQSPTPGQCVDITVHQCQAVDDSFIAYRWWTLNVGPQTITANDVGQPMFPLALQNPTANGEVALDTATGGFSYDADPDFLGQDQFRYSVRCGSLESVPANVNITVRVNQPPVAYYEPGTEQAYPGQGMTFDSCPGTVPMCSYDPEDGTNIAYLWEFGDGFTSQMPLPSHAFANAGTYVVRLTVQDSVGNVSTYLRTVQVDWPDAGPVQSDGGGTSSPLADAGENRTVVEGTEVVLEGSQLGGDDTATWSWTQVRGRPVVLRNSTTAYPSFTAPMLDGSTPEDLVFGLRVSQGATVSRTAFVVIHVVSGNHAPVAQAGGSTSATAGQTAILDGTGSSDPDGDTITYRWEQVLVTGDIVVAIDDATSPTATFLVPEGAPGIMRFRLTVSDGKTLGADEALVAVQSAAPAVLRFTYEKTPTDSGADVVFTAAPGLSSATWDFGDGSPAQTGLVQSHRFEAGSYTVTMTVGEDDEARSYSERIDVQSVKGRVEDASGFPWMPVVLGAAALAILGVALVILARRRQRAA